MKTDRETLKKIHSLLAVSKRICIPTDDTNRLSQEEFKKFFDDEAMRFRKCLRDLYENRDAPDFLTKEEESTNIVDYFSQIFMLICLDIGARLGNRRINGEDSSAS